MRVLGYMVGCLVTWLGVGLCRGYCLKGLWIVSLKQNNRFKIICMTKINITMYA